MWHPKDNNISFKLLSINNGINGAFDTYLSKDTMNATQWETYMRKDAAWYFQSMSRRSTIRIIDTVYSNEVVNHQIFKRQYLKFFDLKGHDTLYLFHYFTRCKAKEKNLNLILDISFGFSDSRYGRKYFELLNSSMFLN